MSEADDVPQIDEDTQVLAAGALRKLGWSVERPELVRAVDFIVGQRDAARIAELEAEVARLRDRVRVAEGHGSACGIVHRWITEAYDEGLALGVEAAAMECGVMHEHLSSLQESEPEKRFALVGALTTLTKMAERIRALRPDAGEAQG